MDIANTECCGVKELDGIDGYRTTDRLMFALCELLFDDGPQMAFLTFTDLTRRKYGKNLQAYIKKHRLGSVISTQGRRNPNSGNTIKHYTWTPNFTAMKKWYAKNR